MTKTKDTINIKVSFSIWNKDFNVSFENLSPLMFNLQPDDDLESTLLAIKLYLALVLEEQNKQYDE